GEEVEFRIVSLNDSSEANVNAIINKLTGKAAGTEITITSVVANASTPYFLITDADQLTVGSLGDDEVLAELALNALVLPENEQEVTENLTLPTTALFGFIVEWTSSNIDVIANNGTVTRGSSDEEVTLTYKVKKGDTVVLTDTINVVVKAVISVPTVTYTETVGDATVAASYGDGTFVGANGVTFTYVHSRNEGLGTSDDYAIEGKGIMLRRSNEPSSLSFTIPGGLVGLTFGYR